MTFASPPEVPALVAAGFVVGTSTLTLQFSAPLQGFTFAGQPLLLDGVAPQPRRNNASATITGGSVLSIPMVTVVGFDSGSPRISYSAVGQPLKATDGTPLPAWSDFPVTVT